MKNFTILAILFTQLILSACSPQNDQTNLIDWQYTDLRLLDPSDCSQSAADILAVYLHRQNSHTFQVRLDMLDVDLYPDFDLYLAINDQPSGNRRLPIAAQADIDWDFLIVVNSNDGIEVFDKDFIPLSNTSVFLFRDSFLDTIILELRSEEFNTLSLDFSVQVFTTKAKSLATMDSVGPAYYSQSPPKPAPVLFGFWNVFAAYTPAQAIRRWDGAHTGPLGDRHGLYNLLRVFNSHAVPVVLFDLTTPLSLSALDFGGNLDWIKNLYINDQVILADTTPLFPITQPTILPDWLREVTLSKYKSVSIGFSIPPSPFLFSDFHSIQSDYHASQYPMILIPTASEQITTTILAVGQYRILPIPINNPKIANQLQPELNGPSLPIRRALIATALGQEFSNSILVLGGDLPQSTWADAQYTRLSLEYLKNRPWIFFLNKYDLLSFKPTKDKSLQFSNILALQQNTNLLLPSQNQILEQLHNTPEGQIKEIALQMLDSLLSPTFPASPELPKLRSNYWAALQELLAVNQWVIDPTIETHCDQASQTNRLAPCILVSPQWYLSFDKENACIRFGFFRLADEIHQIIAPGYQLMSGQSDPSFWNLTAGLRADPTIIPCAFNDHPGFYQVETNHNRLTFFEPISHIQKEFSLSANSLFVEIQSNQPENIPIPLTLDPWVRFTPQWVNRYQSSLLEGEWEWELNPIFRVKTSTKSNLAIITFKDAQGKNGTTENPNAEKKLGLFLPFPMAIAKISGQPVVAVTLSVIPIDYSSSQP